MKYSKWSNGFVRWNNVLPRARPPDYHRTWRAATFYNKTPLTTESPSLLKITERISRDTAVICINARLPVSANDRVLPDVSPCVTRTSVSATKSSAHELAVQMRRVKTFIVNLAIEKGKRERRGYGCSRAAGSPRARFNVFISR